MRHADTPSWLLVLVLTCCGLAGPGMGRHQGQYSLDIADFAVVIPRKVSANGRFLSHEVTHHHTSRAKRSAEDTPAVHYQLSVEGKDLHLELWPSHRFLAPTLMVERRRNGSATRHQVLSPACHYQGAVRGQPESQVALSACDGLAGLLRTKHGEFWVEPARGHSAAGERPHLVFKRDAVSPGAKKRKRKKRKKHDKNCGTREFHYRDLRLHNAVQRQVKTRWERSMSKENHVEALLVADTAMINFHEDGDVETYILTIMNLVSALYLDPTIGNPINVVVVRIILLESAEKTLNITVNADQTLERFCRWQDELNPKNDDNPLHHDVAILITREDICARQNAPCSTLGVAHVAGMCQPDRSCNVNEDNGITLAHTITHELGHNFGMYHDTEKIGCNRREGKTLHVMTPSFEVDTVNVAWSTCSRRDITHFLDQGLGSCLEDEPSTHNYTYPYMPPGAMYNAQQQCRLQFGIHNTTVCSPLEDICKVLWCVVEGMCTTVMRPAAAGTYCGNNMWCQNQECEPIVERPEPEHGGWGEWGEWSECSRTCGAGVAITERHCNDPIPHYGGKFCTGERRRYKVCNIEECPKGEPSFRAQQCTNFNDQEYHGRLFTWLPYFEKSESCKLYCTNKEDNLIIPLNNTVLDGTPCSIGTRDMCINGICKNVGCDWVVGSGAEEDRCGVCQGDGKQCETKRGLYWRKEGSGLKEVVTIPSGSRNIKVEEHGYSKDYISILSATSGEYYLNGRQHITARGEYEVAGTPAVYKRQKEHESVLIPGPIKDSVRIFVSSSVQQIRNCCRGRSRNGSVHYEYTVPKSNVSHHPGYQWAFSTWSPCTASCGGGTQANLPMCYGEGVGQVDDELCESEHRPDQMMRVCNDESCPPRWWLGPWQPCLATCGVHSVRKRFVVCAEHRPSESGEERVLPERDCDGIERPADHETCSDLPPCAPASSRHEEEDERQREQILSPTSDSSDLTGNASAEMMILDEDEIILNSITSSRNQEDILQFMNGADFGDRTLSSGGWIVGAWSACSTTCGPGRQTRSVRCSRVDGACDDALKLSDSKPCHMQRYCDVHWVTGLWGPCSATCGSQPSFKWREVRCENIATGRLMDGCNMYIKPDIREACNLPHCPSGDDSERCDDKLLPRLCRSLKTKCNWWYIKAKCCRTCSTR